MLKNLISFLFLSLVFCLIASSLLPPELARTYFYEAPWFAVLWFIIAVAIIISIVNLLRRKAFALAAICVGLLLILFGGSLTSLLAEEGFIELEEGQTADEFRTEDNLSRPLNFTISLEDFSVELYPRERKGARFVKSYKAHVKIVKDGDLLKEGVIEVNRPLSYAGLSLYQVDYNPEFPDQTLLQVVKDHGPPFVYTGYLFLLIGMLFSFKSVFFKV